jgi:hypothetical protein
MPSTRGFSFGTRAKNLLLLPALIADIGGSGDGANLQGCSPRCETISISRYSPPFSGLKGVEGVRRNEPSVTTKS